MRIVDISTNEIVVFSNTTTAGGSAPTFTSRAFPTGLGPMSIRFADLNRDGKLDAFTANQGLTARDGSVSISIGL